MLDLVVAFDVTRSMNSCFKEVGRRVTELVDRVYTDLPGSRISLYAVGNYNDRAPVRSTPLVREGEKDQLTKFLQGTTASGGGGHHKGGCPACYELALQSALSELCMLAM
jgi:hypothetical protein